MAGLTFSQETIGLEIINSGYNLMRDYPVSEIPVYFFAGRYDSVTPGELAEDYFEMLEAPDKSFIWFDYWLKGIENGIMDEPPIYYYTIGAQGEAAWNSSDRWPLKNQVGVRYYFDEGRIGSVESVNDGTLTTTAPAAIGAQDTYHVDYSTTSGENTRWGAVLSGSNYTNMQPNDEKALTYTTPPLDTALEVTGHPVARLWLVSDAPDLDVFVYLEEVDGKGFSTYVTEGNLRASHRAINAAPYDNLGLPFHSHYQSDLLPVPEGEPFEVVFDLLPAFYLFQQGNRIRVSVAFADAGNFDTPVLDPPPTITLLRNFNYSTYVDLPVVRNP